MTTVFNLVAFLLLLGLVLGLIRIWRGPSIADRLLAAQLFGTTGVALLLVLAELQQEPALRDVALVLALLAVMAVLAFVARVWREDPDFDPENNPDEARNPTDPPESGR